MINTWRNHKHRLCLVLMVCVAACGVPDSSPMAITDKTFSLGLVRVDDAGKEFNLLLCKWQKTYSRAELAEHCVPALVDDAGTAAIIASDFPSKRLQMQVGGAVKWGISVAILAATAYVIGKKIKKIATRARHKNLDMNSMSKIQKLKLEADENLNQARTHFNSVQERFAQVKKLRRESYYDNGIPPNDRRFIPLFRTTDFKSYDSLDKAVKKANKALKTAEANASRAKTMHENAKLLQQWHIDQSNDVKAFKERLLNDLEKINVNTVIIKDGKSYTSMPVAKLRALMTKHEEQLTKLKQELAAIAQADNKKAHKQRTKLLAKIDAHEQMLASNTKVIADLEDVITSFKKSEQQNSMTSAEYQKIYNATMDEATNLKQNNLLQLATATFSALLISRLIDSLSFWGDDERRLAKNWYSLFYLHSDMDYATEAVIDIDATLNLLANKVFPQFHINPAAKKLIASRGSAD